MKIQGLFVSIHTEDPLHKELSGQDYLKRVLYKEKTGIVDIFGYNSSYILKFRDQDHLMSFVLTHC